jgi:hypothetical protein
VLERKQFWSSLNAALACCPRRWRRSSRYGKSTRSRARRFATC